MKKRRLTPRESDVHQQDIPSPASGGCWERADYTLLGILVLVAAILRGFHLDYGLPEVTYVDSIMYVGEARKMLEPGTFTPTFYYYPSVYMDLLAGVYAVLGFTSIYASHLAARCVSSGFDLLTLALVFGWTRQRAGRAWALLAALLYTFSPVNLTSARIENTDSTLTFFMTLTILIAATPPKRIRHWLAAGCAAGLAIGTKYTGLILVPLMFWACGVSWRETKSWRPAVRGLLMAFAAAFVVFWIFTPWYFSHFPEYREAFARQLAVQRTGQIGRVQLGFMDYFFSRTPTWEMPWLSTSLFGNLGAPFLFAAIVALAAALGVRLGAPSLLLGIYALGFVGLQCGPGRVKAVRYLEPAIPILCMLVSNLGYWLAQKFNPAPHRVRMAAILGGAILAGYPAFHSLAYLAECRAPTTNSLARAWMAANLAEKAHVFLSPFFAQDLARLPIQPTFHKNAGGRQYRLPEELGESSERTPLYYPDFIEQLRKGGVEYVVMNSYFDGAYAPVPENRRWFPRSVEGYKGFMERLEAEADVVFKVEGHSAGRLGPDITIYRLR